MESSDSSTELVASKDAASTMSDLSSIVGVTDSDAESLGTVNTCSADATGDNACTVTEFADYPLIYLSVKHSQGLNGKLPRGGALPRPYR